MKRVLNGKQLRLSADQRNVIGAVADAPLALALALAVCKFERGAAPLWQRAPDAHLKASTDTRELAVCSRSAHASEQTECQ